MFQKTLPLRSLLMARSNSSLEQVGLVQKCREAVTFLRWNFTGRSNPAEYSDGVFAELDGYRETYERYTGRPFNEARVLEVGYGARPGYVIALASMGVDVHGIDLDAPLLRFSAVHLMRIFRQNGAERALKSAARSLLFDRQTWASLRVALEQRGYSMNIDPSRFLVGDAAAYDYGSSPFDFVYSENVFEHIPPEGLENLVARLARQLSPQGLALITPDIYTGISGGHLPEWYGHTLEKQIVRKSEPWEHLRKQRFTANTYLNRLPRSAYRELFSRFFEIQDERDLEPDLGRRWLTPEIKAELANWSEEDLLSNRIQFVLRPKSVGR